ncbi:hypothetical protein JCGZ_00429 [Jatropha curcas]|uniref:Gamma-interferon-inducible lysosomal thiol reductase n=1 Tax=Jatropha curcas TaxID=180498 RepID=A0A067JG77_JATCU|nr:hypothetical protein JCGZ_00429 [Jatropha curcas]
MASLIPSSPLIFVFFLLLTNYFASPSASISSENAVTLSLYYETLCPYCADFIVNHLVKHGPNECFLNAIEACAITIYPDVETHFRLIHCIERLSLENKLNEWVNCFEMAGLGKEPIDCYTSGYGNVLEQQFAAETAQLNPQHRFVPWVVVNNQPLQEDFKNFVGYVCKAYQGTQVPEACKSLSMEMETNSLWKANPISEVCFAPKTGNFTSPLAPKIRAL